VTALRGIVLVLRANVLRILTLANMPLHLEFRGTAPPETGKAARVRFRATASTKRAEFGMVRELLEEIGENATGDDVTIEIDAELLAGAK
jgi:hypothetical protein